MDNTIYQNINKELLAKYDENFSSHFLLENEIINTSIKIKAKRYIISTDTLKDVLYINDLIFQKTSDGIYIENLDFKILLICLNEQNYFLAYTNKINTNLKSILYTFMNINNVIIDVTKYVFFFKKETLAIDLYKNKIKNLKK